MHVQTIWSKSDLVDCNIFLEDYDEYSLAKKLI
jgi:hypothetical protein